MTHIFISLRDWFIPLAIRDNSSEYSKAKMIVGIGLLLGIVVLLQSIRSLFVTVNYQVAFTIIMFSAVIMAGPLVLKYTRSKGMAANITLFGLFLMASSVVVMRGGITSSIASYLSMVPFCALMMSGLRLGIVWGGFLLQR